MMRRVRWIGCIAFGIACLATIQAGTFQTTDLGSSPRALIGVVRGDGILLPLVSWQNDAWTVLRSFDAADPGLFRLANLDRFPRDGWTYVPSNGGAPRPLEIGDMITTRAQCNRQEGFTTNAPPDLNLEAAHLMPGVAIHGDFSTSQPEDVRNSPDVASGRVERLIVQMTHETESERAARPARSPRTTIPSLGRERVPVEVTTLVRDRVGDTEYYYFESHKQYGAIESYASGWVASSPFTLAIDGLAAGIYGGGETSRRRGRVLGVLGRGLTRVWVMEMRGYEGESYDIVETRPSRRVISSPGGGC